MNSLDIFFVVIISLFLFRGIFRGLILEASSIAGLVAAFVASNKFYSDLQPVAARIVPSPEWSQALAYVAIFLTTMFAVAILSQLLKKIMRMIMLGWLDHLGGGVLGFIKAGIICGLSLLILTIFLPKDHDLIKASRIAPYMYTMTSSLSDFLPEELRESFTEKTQTARFFLEESLGEMVRPGKEEP